VTWPATACVIFSPSSAVPLAAEDVFGHWHASLQLAYALRGGMTVPVLRRHHGPLRVQKHFHAEGPAVCQHIIVHPPGGIVGGDRLNIDIDVGSSAHALLTSPGAAKWYRGDREATLDMNVQIGSNGVLEWLPLETIFYAGARSAVCNRFDLAADARLLFADVTCFGRPGSGESFADVAGGNWRQHMEIRRDGRLIWLEESCLPAGDALFTSAVGMRGKTVLATLVWAGPPLPADVHEACLAVEPAGFCGMTQLPQIWNARCLCDSAEAAQRWLRALWCVLRPAALGRAAVAPRIWAT
jgi:urease accessory protein